MGEIRKRRRRRRMRQMKGEINGEVGIREDARTVREREDET